MAFQSKRVSCKQEILCSNPSSASLPVITLCWTGDSAVAFFNRTSIVQRPEDP